MAAMDEDELHRRVEAIFLVEDRKLIERLQQAAREEEAREAERDDLRTRTGLQDPELINDLEALGFTPETVSLLPLVPVVQVAWANGEVTHAEHNKLLKLARARVASKREASTRATNSAASPSAHAGQPRAGSPQTPAMPFTGYRSSRVALI